MLQAAEDEHRIFTWSGPIVFRESSSAGLEGEDLLRCSSVDRDRRRRPEDTGAGADPLEAAPKGSVLTSLGRKGGGYEIQPRDPMEVIGSDPGTTTGPR